MAQTDRAFPSLFGRATVAFAEHDALQPSTMRLRRLLSTPDTPTREQWLATFCRFSEHLLSHFGAEENGGYFGTLVEDRPDLRRTIDRLLVDHREMRDQLEVVMNLFRQDATCLATQTLGTLLDALDDHERRESTLMRDFLEASPAG